MRLPSNITQFQPAADRSSEACRLITDAIMHELPERDEQYVGPDEQIYAIVLVDGRTSVGRMPDFDGDADAGTEKNANADAVTNTVKCPDAGSGGPAADFAALALATDAADGTIACATPVQRTPITASQEIVTWAISSYVPEQFATATLLTVLYWRETANTPIGQTTQYWATDQLPFEEATAHVVSCVDAEIEAAQWKAAELVEMLAPGGRA